MQNSRVLEDLEGNIGQIEPAVASIDDPKSQESIFDNQVPLLVASSEVCGHCKIARKIRRTPHVHRLVGATE